MDERILALRKEVDRVNRELLRLLSERGRLVQEIGRIQTELGLPHYDPKREEEMLAYLTAENPGPFPAETIRKLFKEIFQASLDLEERQDQKKFLYSKAHKPEPTRVRVKDVVFGEKPLLIAGPCSIESEAQMLETARFLAGKGVRVLRGGAFKPRTSPYGFQGLGVEGLRIGRRAADTFGMVFVTEVMDTRDVEVVAEYADILQIGARNMQNFALLKEVGKAGRPVLLKRGLSATMEEWFYAAEYILSQGNEQVILAERGIRTFERWTRNTLDLSAVALAKQETHLPVIVDVTHAAGRTDLLAPLARAALAVGADGVHVEVHPNPKVALSDNQQQLDFPQFARFLEAIRDLLPGG
ncbi:MAG: bifunctional 3-deoxy-7-phosphoheptulonate synthase/chorismate mutase [Thermus sp.]|uniref:bifunctional 3-deoxy-7-phosphoheptulonate synthase/chorismate mutase n=1 Tax=Thermus sp. TaxID=275 RepID=UPI0025CE39E7|nr:bifunctional 3-deoxy-7-phosphoheptulonate synthase/chorismate mutase [Thermus sp.]MCS6868250.1 bifunctional 3-deoxy-7-phosphoheptulonate synthase/chorismate mutase [Thermus sp.]MCS7218661.1 bifunctional 3-deoxy-7-phosphoheptulonate synthase/chorismate mutase [Thermus sp.]MCX7848593.1 bifunctional 3-deoxy-7-phosphoheptulonate synthase/chorismate mutase [Thermus sp.]MDW8017912.1 bifunctional 3-deoxy-7-phosphoheptulonate synthase/chorismate mutase [Thermus sp.]MDW8357162.1 bifunctional 3-deoxy